MNYKEMYLNTINGIMEEFKKDIENIDNYSIQNLENGFVVLYENNKIGSFDYIKDENLTFTIEKKYFDYRSQSGEVENANIILDIDFSKINDINDFVKLITNTEKKIIQFKRSIENYEYLDISKQNVEELSKKFGTSLVSTTHKKHLSYETNIPYSHPHYFSSNILYKDKGDDLRMINIFHSYDKDKKLISLSFDRVNLTSINEYDRNDILTNDKIVKSFDDILKEFENSFVFQNDKEFLNFVTQIEKD